MTKTRTVASNPRPCFRCKRVTSTGRCWGRWQRYYCKDCFKNWRQGVGRNFCEGRGSK